MFGRGKAGIVADTIKLEIEYKKRKREQKEKEEARLKDIERRLDKLERAGR